MSNEEEKAKEAVHAADFKNLVPRLLIGNKDIKKYAKAAKNIKKRKRR